MRGLYTTISSTWNRRACRHISVANGKETLRTPTFCMEKRTHGEQRAQEKKPRQASHIDPLVSRTVASLAVLTVSGKGGAADRLLLSAIRL